MISLAISLGLWSALGAAPPAMGPHRGLLAKAGDLELELVVGPERIALYPLDSHLAILPLVASDKVTLVCEGHATLPLLAASDHFEADNPYGVSTALVFGAVVQRTTSAEAARFAFNPAEASTFHDHRPYHGGIVGMVGDRHLELAVVPSNGPSGKEAELQLFVTDAYRQPIALAGITARAQINDRTEIELEPVAGSFVGRVPQTKGPLDVHAEVRFPGEAEPVSMDFYVEKKPEPAQAGDQPIKVKVTGGGFVPERIEATAGRPIKLRFMRTSRDTCGKQVVFPSLGVTRDLPLDKPVEVDLIAPKGELSFTCGMRMLKGSVIGL
jgi:hypothetical protein